MPHPRIGRRQPAVKEPALTLIVETDEGDFIRRIKPATPLGDGEPGTAAEDATRSAAATYGLPDFVFRSAIRATGTRTREVGDALIVVGDVGAVVQVKHRANPTTDPDRERGWLDKRIERAARQAAGTTRTVTAAVPQELVNERGRIVRLNTAAKAWVSVVVVDHPTPPEDYIPTSGAQDAVVLLRRDWEFLFEQLKSTDAVVRYLHRIAPDGPVPLGAEPVRYYEYADADARKPPDPPDPRITVPGTDTLSSPVLPRAPAGAEDRRHHQLIRMMLEDIATSPLGEDRPEASRLDVLAAIDTLPIDYRATLGRQLLAWLRDVASEVEGIKWAFRRVLRPDHPHVAVAAATLFNDAVLEGFRRWVVLRHTQMLRMLGDRPELRTVAVLLTPRRDGHRPWDTTMVSVQGELDVDDTYLADAERLWPLTAG